MKYRQTYFPQSGKITIKPNEAWLKSLKNDPVIELNLQVAEDIKSGIVIKTAHGIFGPEDAGSDGFTVEQKDEQGRKYLKVYGCKYPYKELAPHGVVAAIQFPKYFISGFPRRVIGQSKILSLAVIWQFLFTRKRFIRQLIEVFSEFNHKTMWFYNIPETEKERITEKDYYDFELEIGRAGRLAIQNEGLWTELGELVVKFAQLFFYLDNTYRYRVQDAFSEIKHMGDGVSEFFRLLDILASRETSLGVGYKWAFIKRAMKLALLTSPALRRIINRFIHNLDAEKIKMDDIDWYWCLKFQSYNFRGMSKEWRYAERERLDKENGTIFLI